MQDTHLRLWSSAKSTDSKQYQAAGQEMWCFLSTAASGMGSRGLSRCDTPTTDDGGAFRVLAVLSLSLPSTRPFNSDGSRSSCEVLGEMAREDLLLQTVMGG